MAGRFRIAPTKHYLKETRKLPGQVRERLVTVVEELASNPYLGVRLRENCMVFRYGESVNPESSTP